MLRLLGWSVLGLLVACRGGGGVRHAPEVGDRGGGAADAVAVALEASGEDVVAAAADAPAPGDDAEQGAEASPPVVEEDAAAEAERAAACIERLGGPGESETTERGFHRTSRTVLRAPAVPTGRRVVLLRAERELVLELEPFAAALEGNRRPEQAAALRGATGDEVRFDRVPRPSGGTWDEPSAIDFVLADQLEAQPFLARDPASGVVERTLVRHESASQDGGRSGSGWRSFHTTDCVELLRVVDWIS